MNDVIGANIARFRKEKSMTQEQLANLMGISYQAVSKWENGLSSPDISSFPLLADVFGVTIDELFGREGKTLSAETAPAEVKELPWPDDDCLYAVLYHGHTLVGSDNAAEKKKIEFQYEGPALNIKSDFSVRVEGDVGGNIEAGDSVECDGVGGGIRAGGSVTCDAVKGDVSAGGSITCDAVSDSVRAGANVSCGNIAGDVFAGGCVQCESINGRE